MADTKTMTQLAAEAINRIQRSLGPHDYDVPLAEAAAWANALATMAIAEQVAQMNTRLGVLQGLLHGDLTLIHDRLRINGREIKTELHSQANDTAKLAKAAESIARVTKLR
jgi:hypothetical protein